MRSRLIFVATGLVAGVALTLGAIWANGFRSQVETWQASIGVGVNPTTPGTAMTFQVAGLCLTAGRRAEITAVRPQTAYGNELKVVRFSLAPYQADGTRRRQNLETYLEKVESPWSGPANTTLATRCTDTAYGLDYRGLAAELRTPNKADLPIVIKGFVIEYKIRGITKTVEAETGVSFCANDDRDKPIADLEDAGGNSLDVWDCQTKFED